MKTACSAMRSPLAHRCSLLERRAAQVQECAQVLVAVPLFYCTCGIKLKGDRSMEPPTKIRGATGDPIPRLLIFLEANLDEAAIRVEYRELAARGRGLCHLPDSIPCSIW